MFGTDDIYLSRIDSEEDDRPTPPNQDEINKAREALREQVRAEIRIKREVVWFKSLSGEWQSLTLFENGEAVATVSGSDAVKEQLAANRQALYFQNVQRTTLGSLIITYGIRPYINVKVQS